MEKDQQIIQLLAFYSKNNEVIHAITYGFECMGGQDICIMMTDENGYYLEEYVKDRLNFYQTAINRVVNRKRGTLPLEWDEILPKDILDEINGNPTAGEILYQYFYNELGGTSWKYWRNSEKRLQKCIEIAKKCRDISAKI